MGLGGVDGEDSAVLQLDPTLQVSVPKGSGLHVLFMQEKPVVGVGGAKLQAEPSVQVSVPDGLCRH